MATQAQYDAAKKAIHDLANKMIAGLPFFERGAAENALNDNIVGQFAKVSVDAALAATPTS